MRGQEVDRLEALRDGWRDADGRHRVRHGAPARLVQLVRDRTSRQKTARFMQHEGVALTQHESDALVKNAAFKR
jgi:hypothetical protein